MTGLRKAALAAIALLVAAATFTSFAESYRALLSWASHHGLHGVWAAAWPLQVDVFIAVGELALFVALADSWQLRSRAAAWTVTTIGLAVSIAGNVGHSGSHDWASRATAAVPPVAAAAALAVGLGVLKRIHADLHENSPWERQSVSRAAAQPYLPARRPESLPAVPGGPAPVPAALNGHASAAAALFASELGSGRVPSIRAIRSGLHIGQPTAQQVQAYLRTITRTP